jgi:acyl dehydratase
MPLASLADIQAKIGHSVGFSDWIQVTQDRIDAFAETTEDRQFIHVDPALASRTPFGGTIAHGFLSLSLLSRMAADVMLVPDTTKMAINYGLERVRFLAAVRAGSFIRGQFTLKAVVDRAPGQLMLRHEVRVEIGGESKPALTAEWLSLIFT